MNWFGLFAVFALLIGGSMAWFKYEDVRQQRKIQRGNELLSIFESALLSVPTSMPGGMKGVQIMLMREGFYRADLLRDAEVIFESIAIAANSHKAITSSSRLELAQSIWSERGFPLRITVSKECADQLQAEYEKRVSIAHTQAAINQIASELTKQQALKTNAAKQRCVERMTLIANAAVKNQFVDKAHLCAKLTEMGITVETNGNSQV